MVLKAKFSNIGWQAGIELIQDASIRREIKSAQELTEIARSAINLALQNVYIKVGTDDKLLMEEKDILKPAGIHYNSFDDEKVKKILDDTISDLLAVMAFMRGSMKDTRFWMRFHIGEDKKVYHFGVPGLCTHGSRSHLQMGYRSEISEHLKKNDNSICIFLKDMQKMVVEDQRNLLHPKSFHDIEGDRETRLKLKGDIDIIFQGMMSRPKGNVKFDWKPEFKYLKIAEGQNWQTANASEGDLQLILDSEDAETEIERVNRILNENKNKIVKMAKKNVKLLSSAINKTEGKLDILIELDNKKGVQLVAHTKVPSLIPEIKFD